MYFTSGSDRAFEQLMQTRPGADHFDSGEAGAPEDCGTGSNIFIVTGVCLKRQKGVNHYGNEQIGAH